jgi:guanylate kinase
MSDNVSLPTETTWRQALDQILASRKSLLFIVSGPTGSGKTTICDRLLATFPEEMERIVTATTRPPRPGEEDEKDYYFFDPETFARKVEAGDFYEHATVHGRSYGVLRSEVVKKLQSGRHALLNIDVQGAKSFRIAAEEDDLLKDRVVSIFLMLPSLKTILERLEARGAPVEDLDDRLTSAARELKHWPYYNYTIISGDRNSDFETAASIFKAESLRIREIPS